MDETESCTIYISLETSHRLSFVYYVEKDTVWCFQVIVHSGNSELSGKSDCSHNQHPNNKLNLIPEA